MRRAVMIGLSAAAGAVCGGGLLLMLHHRAPLDVGRELMAAGDMHRASLYLREAVRDHPANAEAAFRLGIVDLDLGNAAAAELELKRARLHGYDKRAILMPLGHAYLQQHHYDQLLHDFDPATAPASELSGIQTLRSLAELAQGNLTKAQEDAAAAVARAPDAAEAQIASARVSAAAGDLPAASATLERVLKTAPHNPDALLLRASIALNQGRAQAALDDSQTVLADSPKRLEGKLMRVRALASLGHEKEARAAVDEVLQASKHDGGANYLRMVLAIRSHDWKAASDSLDVIAPVIGNVPRGLFYMGLVKMEVGQPAQAEEAVTKFLTGHPDDVEAHKLMAYIDLQRRRPAAALAQLQTPLQEASAGHADADTLDLQGRAQAMAGDAKGAEATLAKAQALAPKDENILNRLAAVHLSLGDVDAADSELRHSLAIAPGQTLAGETLVRGLLQRGDIAGARSALADLQHAVGDTELTGLLQAEIQLAVYDVGSAQATLQDLVKHYPDSDAATLMLVRVDGQLGQTDRAQSLLTQLLHRHPASQAALEIELPLLLSQRKNDEAVALAEAAHEAAAGKPGITAALAATYLRAGDSARAIALLDRAGGTSQDPALILLRARSLVTAGRTDAATGAYRDLLDAAPASAEGRRELAMLLASKQDYDGARTILKDGLRASPGNPLLLQSAVGLELKAGGAEAAQRAAETMAADPAMQPASRLLPGDLLAAQGDQARAAEAYLAAFKTAPSSALAVHAADAMVHAGRPADASALLTGWLATHPDDPAALSVQSSIELQQKHLPEAAALLDHLVSLRPSDPLALNNLAWLRSQAGDHDAALALARRAYFVSPQPSSADTLGWIMVGSGDVHEALPLLQQASESGHAPDQIYHYAAALARAGQKDQARALLEKLLSGKPGFEERADAQKLFDSLGS